LRIRKLLILFDFLLLFLAPFYGIMIV